MKKTFLINLLLGILAVPVFAQQNISGKITDSENSEPLIGVSIMKKNSSMGAITDMDGNFSIHASAGDILILKYIGYATKEIPVEKGKWSYNIQMTTESVNLQEVIAVGYGSVKKRDLTGSVSSLKGDNLVKLQVANVGQALIGKAPGVLVTSPGGDGPGSSPSIIIRGENSINGNNSPLWVIDGFTRSGGANTVDPEDIESIEILKDASSTAIYGSRGAGGVIIVTTKKGAKSIRPHVDFKVSSGIKVLTRELEMMAGPSYYQYWMNSGIGNYFDPAINPDNNYNWVDAITQNAMEESYFTSVYGGNKDLNYKITADYLGQTGIIKYNNDYKRLNIRSYLDINVNKYVKVGLTAYFQRTWKNSGGGGSSYQSAIEKSPLLSINNEDGSYNYKMDERDQSVVSSNMIENLKDKINKTQENSNNLQAYISLEPVKGLVFKSSGAITYWTSRNQQFSPKHLNLTDNMNSAQATEYQSDDYEWINTLSLNKEFDKIHSVNAVIGNTLEGRNSFTVGAWGQDFPTDDFEYWAIGSGPKYELTDASELPIIRNSGWTGYDESTLLSYFGRLNYTLLDRYLFTITGRYDGASQLAEGHKWAFFPSAAFAWRLSEEKFIKDLNVFDNLKFRLSWGRTGSQGVGNYSTLGLATRGGYTLQNGVYKAVYAVNDLANPNLTWEKTNQTDAGIDLGFFNNRLRVAADCYYKYTYDMFVTKNLPAETGYGSYLSNDGKMANKGFELEISGDPLVSKTWKISTGLNFSLNRNKILNMGSDSYKVYTNKNSYGELLSYNYVGSPVSLIYGWVYDGIWQNEEDIKYGAVDEEAGVSQTKPGDIRYKDINNDGVINDDDKVLIMNPHNKFIGAFDGTIGYKNISLSFQFQGVFGHQIYNYTKKSLFNNLAFRENAWTESSGIQDQPSAGNENIKDSDYFVEDGSYVKLKNVTFSYMLPVSWMKTIGISSAEIYCTGKDLLTFTGYSGYNPEVSRNGYSESFRGVDYNSYPSTYSVYMGVKVSF